MMYYEGKNGKIKRMTILLLNIAHDKMMKLFKELSLFQNKYSSTFIKTFKIL